MYINKTHEVTPVLTISHGSIPPNPTSRAK